MKKILLSIFFALSFCVFTFAQESKTLKILEKPVPLFTEEQRELNICVQGTVTLRVDFLENGQIGKVLPVSGLPYGLTESAIEAAKKIKFEPQIKNDKPINVTKVVSYNYSWEHDWKVPSLNINQIKTDEKAEAIIKKAVEKLGGEKYLQVKSQIGRGTFSVLRENIVISFQSFVDVIVFPDKERTEFKGAGKTVQTNVGKTGWIFDGDTQIIKEQNPEQIENFRRGMNVSLDNLLRGQWQGNAVLSYVGRRQASLGKRNDVVKLVYADGFAVEFEFADDGTPVKSIHKRTGADNEEIKEEDRYAQFIDVSGIKTPFVVDRFTNGAHASRINYESVEFNKPVSDAIFTKPKSIKEMKKDLKL